MAAAPVTTENATEKPTAKPIEKPTAKPIEMLETRDIQGLVVRGYGDLKAARFLMLTIVEGKEPRAREYLQGLADRLNRASKSPDDSALQVAFTIDGLEQLGVPRYVRDTFSREFIEGMHDEVRTDSLGDRGLDDPKHWTWGRRDQPRVHVLLLAYAKTGPILDALVAAEITAMGDGLTVLHTKETVMLEGQTEHFGWRDGISMPKIEGVPKRLEPRKKKQEWWTDPMKPGEFVLGYRNDYNAFTESPTVEAADDPANLLPIDPADPDRKRKSLGRNGTYLVFREMNQFVERFWDYLATESREPGADPAARAIALGSKMVGRWPSGAPLITSPDEDLPARKADNKFLFGDDKFGLRCPLGSHIRRANPRDELSTEERGQAGSIAMVRKHMMVRRGRAFGPPLVKSMSTRAIFAARDKPDGERRGLHFLCLVGDIARQFEFVQRAWVHSANFAALSKDGDPISSARREPGHENPNNEFTCPAEPVRRKYKNLPPFTQLVGGAYFFLPGIAALRFIARTP